MSRTGTGVAALVSRTQTESLPNAIVLLFGDHDATPPPEVSSRRRPDPLELMISMAIPPPPFPLKLTLKTILHPSGEILGFDSASEVNVSRVTEEPVTLNAEISPPLLKTMVPVGRD